MVLCDLSAIGRNGFVWIVVAGWLMDSAGSQASFGCRIFNQCRSDLCSRGRGAFKVTDPRT